LTKWLQRAASARIENGLGKRAFDWLDERRWRAALSSQKIVVALLSIFGGIALLLAGVGLHGVVYGLVLAVGGVALGTIVAMFLTHLIAVGTLLYQVNPRNPMAFLVAAVVMIAISIVACFTPAWHAARTDPIRALRE
jgi:ABC-type lipoprotein release transport system permease subunit